MIWARGNLGPIPEGDTGHHFRQLVFPFSRRQVREAAITSLNTISLAVVGESAPLVRTVRCRTTVLHGYDHKAAFSGP